MKKVGAKLGHIVTEKTKEKIRMAHLGKKHSWGNKISLAKIGYKMREETKIKIGNSNRGKKLIFSEETKKKMSNSKKGNKHPNWKGGITSINKRIRISREYKIWRKSVFERDNYTCVFCLKRGGSLEVDHVKPFAYFPELRFAIDNGRTLCIDCHKTTDTYMGRCIRKYGKIKRFIELI